MDIKTARAAIEAILAAIPDDELPEFDRVEIGAAHNDGRPIVWCGGVGYNLGTAHTGGIRDPLVYRNRASWGAIDREMAYRADRRLLDNGDDPTGVRLAAKVVRG